MRWLRQIVLQVVAMACVLDLSAQLVADAGRDSTSALFVPVILDGSASRDIEGRQLAWFWEQVSGDPLDLIGWDRRKALVISVGIPGTYRFKLHVSNGEETKTDVVTHQVIESAGRVLYADNQLDKPTKSYSILNRNPFGTDGVAFPSIQEAANDVQPGDTVLIRGGVYANKFISNEIYLSVAKIETSGRADAPIRFEAFANEEVDITGFGFEDRDLDRDGFADGPVHPQKRETLLLVEGDYVHIRGLRFFNSGGSAVKVTGSFCYIEECRAFDNWYDQFIIRNDSRNTLEGTVFRFVESCRSRHGSGAFLDINSREPGLITATAIVDSLFYDNGFQRDGEKVLKILGDPAGGGNSDGITIGKSVSDCADFVASVENFGPDNILLRNICYHNADDGIDICFAESLLENNYCLLNGPEGNKGFKVFRPVRGLVFRGNLASGNHGIGFEMRSVDTMTVINNSSIGNGRQGMWGGITRMHNNLCASNKMKDLAVESSGYQNWAEDGINVSRRLRGTPELKGSEIDPGLIRRESLMVKEKVGLISSMIEDAFSPASGSPLIDSGMIVDGFHCPRADDDPKSPMPPTASGRHWYGKAPDIGAFEFVPDNQR